jgi:hypothetical protein
MARKSSPSRPREGVSGKTRICARCGESVENAVMHPVLKVWLCAADLIKLNQRTRDLRVERAFSDRPDPELRHMMKTNKKMF